VSRDYPPPSRGTEMLLGGTPHSDTGDRCDPVFGFFSISLLYGEKVKSASPCVTCVTCVTPERGLIAERMVGGDS